MNNLPTSYPAGTNMYDVVRLGGAPPVWRCKDHPDYLWEGWGDTSDEGWLPHDNDAPQDTEAFYECEAQHQRDFSTGQWVLAEDYTPRKFEGGKWS